MAEEATEIIDSQNDTENTENTEETTQESTELTAEEKIAALEEKNQRLFARAKKAEGFEMVNGEWIKKPKPEPAKPPTITQPTDNSDELRLIAKGFDDESIEQAKVIAKGKSISLLEAVKDPLFTVYQKEQKELARKEKAKLGASKGSGPAEQSGIRPGMSKDEHKEAWEKAVGLK